ncbi:MAG: HEPN domain-containing protein [Cytophagales bacterium]
MTKEQHINFWVQNANDDFDTALYNFKGKKNVYCLFFLHLSVEKLLIAIWIKDNISNTPPFIHDLKSIYSATELDLEIEQIDFLSIVNDWNISARYPDYKRSLYLKATDAYTAVQVEKIEKLRKCLLEKSSLI